MRTAQQRVFRKSRSLEELAREQGVAPVDDLRDIDKLWPRDDDPDELLRFILGERDGRRRQQRRRK